MDKHKKTSGIGNYSDQYKDPRWIERRNEIIEIDGGMCKRCGSTDKLQVHHLFYDHRDIWEYSDNDLFTLCEPCHKKIHYLKSEILSYLNQLMMRWCYGDRDSNANYENAYSVLNFMIHGKQTGLYAKSCSELGFIFNCEG